MGITARSAALAGVLMLLLMVVPVARSESVDDKMA